MPPGRKLLPMEQPRLPLQKFAWLVRAIRAFHEDPAVQDTFSFTLILNKYLDEQLKPATVNRLENGEAEFSIERCTAYEKALGLAELDLVDCYLYACRAQDQMPRTSSARVKEATSMEIELLWRLAEGEYLLPLDWLRLAYLYRNRPDLFASPRIRECFLHRLLDDAGHSFEKEERLVREVLVVTGSDVLTILRERVRADPLRYFNMCEAVGFMTDEQSLAFLTDLFLDSPDGAVAATALEPLRRSLYRRGLGPESLGDRTDLLKEYAINALHNTNEFFTAREEALSFLRWGRFNLTGREKTRLSDLREDLWQLRVSTAEPYRKELATEVTKHFAKELSVSPLALPGMPLAIPGLRSFVEDGLFASERLDRLLASILIRPWRLSGLLGKAVGTVVSQRVEAKDYGIQRAGVRFLTKLLQPECLEPVRKIGWSVIRDDSVRLTVAWALGTGIAEQDAGLLAHLGRTATTSATRRVVAMSAARLRARQILEELAKGRDEVAAAEAGHFLRRLDAERRDRTHHGDAG